MNTTINVTCAVCNCPFAMPKVLFEAASHSDKIFFYCPYGHKLVRTPKGNDPIEENIPEEDTPENEVKDNIIEFPGNGNEKAK